jgi:hypothetical protein
MAGLLARAVSATAETHRSNERARNGAIEAARTSCRRECSKAARSCTSPAASPCAQHAVRSVRKKDLRAISLKRHEDSRPETSYRILRILQAVQQTSQTVCSPGMVLMLCRARRARRFRPIGTDPTDRSFAAPPVRSRAHRSRHG